MAVKIRLMRMGKIRNPQYRIVIADSRTKRDGRAIEYVGIYQPKHDPSLIEVKSDRVQHWLSVGAQPSEAVQRILELTGDWQQFKGLPAPTKPLLIPAVKARQIAAAEAAAAAAEEPGTTAVEEKPAKKAAPKKAKADDKTKADDKAKVDDKAKAEAAPVESAAETTGEQV
ncbi:hypothetical protein GCM10010124_20880 [Pilimelia terevasa]|uniref:Small ribosomal subunit protein bS16 n=1 Tax=Pilimelia terevasa TaxID=53372 RepID=A0A8J3FKF9_9ACTN|nr:30S ribosomal protein S16 [Pilimelia terevasa]GGK28091.1 hypothetical protein GCM10010124_20880 [Pilimelia terevasa]